MNGSRVYARALTESALLDLFVALDAAESPETFLSIANAIVSKPSNLLSLPVDLGKPDDLEIGGKRAVDVNNAPKVHDYLGEMDRANASDARLWSYLALATYRAYMEKRWPLKQGAGDDNWKRRVKDRWLLHNGAITRGRLIRHGIARLWWIAHLTFRHDLADSSKPQDPYIYTREVFKSEDRINALFDREAGAIPTVFTAVLDHAIEVGAVATDKYVQSIMQYLTLVNGYRDLGMLDAQAIKRLITAGATHAQT